MEKKELVLKVLIESKDPLRPGDIAEKSGLSKEDVEKILKELKKEGKIDSPKRCFYQIKK
ncbi:MAG: FaeA/PapI family transcriptional regulator [Fervidobacterium sp.]